LKAAPVIAFLINTLHEGARGQKQAACIGVHNPVVFLVSDVLHRPRLRPDARVVDEDVEATERIQGLFAQALRGLAIADFMFDGDRLTINVFTLFSAVAPADSGPRLGITPLGSRRGATLLALRYEQALLAVNFHIRIKHAPAHPFLFYSFLNGSFARRED
jgi:hypothetical protein